MRKSSNWEYCENNVTNIPRRKMQYAFCKLSFPENPVDHIKGEPNFLDITITQIAY